MIACTIFQLKWQHTIHIQNGTEMEISPFRSVAVQLYLIRYMGTHEATITRLPYPTCNDRKEYPHIGFKNNLHYRQRTTHTSCV